MVKIVSASGDRIPCDGKVCVRFHIGNSQFLHTFYVVPELTPHMILGTDFQKKHRMRMGWTKDGSFEVELKAPETPTSLCQVSASPYGPEADIPLFTYNYIRIPARSVATVPASTLPGLNLKDDFYQLVNLQPVHTIAPNLYLIPLLYHSPDKNNVECTLVNLAQQSLHIPEGARIASLRLYQPDHQGAPQKDVPDPRQSKTVERDQESPTTFLSQITTEVCLDESSSTPRSRKPLKTLDQILPRDDHEERPPRLLNEPDTQILCARFRKENRSPTHSYRPSLQPIVEEENLEAYSLQPVESKFIVSPADVEVRVRPESEDAPVTDEIRRQFEDLKIMFTDIFSTHAGDLGQTPIIVMDIDTGDSKPISQKPYTIPLKHQEWVKNEIDILEKAGIIERSISPWASPIVIVPKKLNPLEPPSMRLCVDYRALNSLNPPIKRPNSRVARPMTLTPLPRIDELLTRFHNVKIFSSIDLRSGFHHIVLSPESQRKSAFVTPQGKWEFKRVPFGLTQAPAYFQRVMDEILAGYHGFSMGYLDDIIVFSETPEEHIEHLKKVFLRLRQAGMKIKESKCAFMKATIAYLGHIISTQGVHPMADKLQAIKQMPAPRNVKEIQQFLGLAGYYRKFVPRYSDISKPLTDLLHHDAPFIWSDECEQSFKLLKQYLCASPILTYPDPSKDYVLYTDASKYGWAGLLMQEHEIIIEGEKKRKNLPIQYVSGKFRGPQINWAALVKEAYAIYQCVKKLTFYLSGATCFVYTDHKPLERFLERNTLNATVNNWALELEQYDLKVTHVKGVKNTLADALSRLIEIDPTYQLAQEPHGEEFGKVTSPACVEDGNMIALIKHSDKKTTDNNSQRPIKLSQDLVQSSQSSDRIFTKDTCF